MSTRNTFIPSDDEYRDDSSEVLFREAAVAKIPSVQPPVPSSSGRLYPMLDRSDILTSAMRGPRNHFGRTASIQPSSPFAKNSNDIEKLNESDTDTETDIDDDDAYCSPVEDWPEELDKNKEKADTTISSPYESRTSRIAKALGTPFSSPAPLSSRTSSHSSDSYGAATDLDSPIIPSRRMTEVSTASQPALSRAVTLPGLSASSSSSADTSAVRRAYSMNDRSNVHYDPLSLAQLQDALPALDTSSSRPAEYVIIAHDATAQKLMDSHSLSWGCQYELARGVSQGWWSWEDVRQKRANLDTLGLENQLSAPHVAEAMGKPGYGALINPALWIELDREQKAIMENKGRALGLQGEWEGTENWYGGRIQQMARLVYSKDKAQPFSIQLYGMLMARSHRFARFLGSRRLLQVKLPKNLTSKYEDLRKWFDNKFVLCGRVYVPFATKEDTVYMVETKEDYEREPCPEDGDNFRLSLSEFVEWHNPISLNKNQIVNKFAARFDLGLSTSVPALRFEPENVGIIPDECVPGCAPKPEPQDIHTDGCGFMNAAALMAIGRHLLYATMPTAVQGRFLGSKGVWLLHPDDQEPDSPPRIWIRPSQRKINLVDPSLFSPNFPLDPDVLKDVPLAHLIFDVVAPSKTTQPARLNRLTLANLSSNDVPSSLFVSLMEDTLREKVKDLTQWDGPGAMPLLWNAVNQAEGTTQRRLQQNAAGLQRALGLASRVADDLLAAREFDEDEDLSEEPVECDRRADTKPMTPGERILERLQAGFTPKEDKELFSDIRTVVKTAVESAVSDYHITVGESVEMFIVPDPYGVLEEGQIQCKSSQYLMDPLHNLQPNALQGDVLIYRNPARLPSDVQKVTAVTHPKLNRYVDVIVLPTKGAQSLASLLAGGDVDGDVAVCIFHREMVDAFTSPPITRVPTDLQDDYEPMTSVPRMDFVEEELQRAASTEQSERILRNGLLIGLADHRIGLYSMMHEIAVYAYGYDDSRSVRLAHKFNINLDSRKNGHVIRRKIFAEDCKQYQTGRPDCLKGLNDTSSYSNRKLTTRILTVPFVLDDLRAAGKRVQDDLLSQYDARGRSLAHKVDGDLLDPYKRIADTQHSQLQFELSIVIQSVEHARAQYRKIWVGSDDVYGSNEEDRKAKKKASQDKLQKLAEEFARPLEGVELLTLLRSVDEVKASYAYERGPTFAFNMAFQRLCQIKARTKGSVAFTREFAESMNIPNGVVRVLKQRAAISGL